MRSFQNDFSLTSEPEKKYVDKKDQLIDLRNQQKRVVIEPASPDLAPPRGANADVHPPRVNREEMNDEDTKAPGKQYNR